MRSRVFFGILATFFLVTIAIEVSFYDSNFFKVREINNISANITNVIFFLFMIMLFPLAARTYHNRAFIDFKKVFTFQAFGVAFTLIINLIINVKLLWNSKTDDPLLSETYLGLQILQMIGLFVFVLSKRPLDLFSTFSKRPDL